MAPKVSIAMGMNLYMFDNWLYLASFFLSARAATDPGAITASDRYVGARVLTQVTSHTIHLPDSQGTMVIPSGLFPSERARPEGSSLAGILAASKACKGRHLD